MLLHFLSEDSLQLSNSHTTPTNRSKLMYEHKRESPAFNSTDTYKQRSGTEKVQPRAYREELLSKDPPTARWLFCSGGFVPPVLRSRKNLSPATYQI